MMSESDVTFKAKAFRQSKSDILPPDEPGGKTVVRPLSPGSENRTSCSHRYLGPLISMSATDVHALGVDADLVEVLDGNQPPGNSGRVQGLWKWLRQWQ